MLDIEIEIMEKIKKSLEFKTRAHIWHHCLSILNDDDICLEFGVFNGKSINYMADVKPNNLFYGFDSFEGLPEKWIPSRPIGHFKIDFNKLKFHKNIKIYKGIFSEAIPLFLDQEKDKISKIKLIHIDCDIYSSTKTILELMGKTIKENKCILLFDEFYNYREFKEHEFLAFKEFIQNNSINYKILGRNANHQQVLIKVG